MTASVHWRTPSLAVIDCRGLPIRQVAYLRTLAEDTPSAFATCQRHDVAGRLVAQQDARLQVANTTTVYALNGAAVYTDSVDSGWRLVLPGLAGEPLERWDERGHHWQSTFDTQLRVTTLKEDSDIRIDSFSYGESSADAGHNLRGQLTKQTDPSGSLALTSYALTGQTLEETRTFDDGKAFTSRQVFSPLGAVLEQIDAGGHRKASRYGLAGQIKKVELEVETKVTQVLQDTQYNANDQIISQLAGNGVLSRWTYDPADGRLSTRTSQKAGQARLQDLAYFYDRVGNIIRIEDNAFEPTWFANQRVDGLRTFIYDSWYRLICATGYDDALPPDTPGRPRPPEEKNRLNYTQMYAYDEGGNLKELRHQRDGGSRTRRMCIDEKSNRGMRWQTGDEPPDFDIWFDPHGNQRRLRHGPTLHWNNRDELEHIDLVIRQDSANDAEYYRYSQGVRVFKRHDTFASGVNHFQQVRYLPGLEIRTRDNGEELHIISVGNARCLHWVSNPPAERTQLRYTLEDHLGSCVMELNEDAVVTSAEGYYPFGETAWMAPESEIEYRFVRYSGKEMDVSGLYYYGARYYAPWLQRWVSADPAGDVDGLNLYAFVGNNPASFVDVQGNNREGHEIVNFANFLTVLSDYSVTAQEQIENISFGRYGVELLANFVGEGINAAASFIGGLLLGPKISSVLPDDPHMVNFTEQSKPPFLEGLVGGNIAGTITGEFADHLMSPANLIKPLIPQTSAMSVAAIDEKIGLTEGRLDTSPANVSQIFMNYVVGSVIGGVGATLSLGQRVQEVEDIKNGLDPVKIQKIETMLADWKEALTSRMAIAEKAYRRLGRNTFDAGLVIPNIGHSTAARTIRLETLREETSKVLGFIETSQTMMSWYKEDLLTDNRFLRKQAQPKSRFKAAFQNLVRPFTRHKNPHQ
ncbi:RHS repeat domain-containing protein [Pseudomonas moraviensis]|uniref:RHS repeat domain-containing protein n=1 Tax=Pseudomonas moraviensis TaxID=321662 RepID=UPI0010599D78|nr:RHS repeat-associated core domain-containing protein [Pseudomonas moraviensis]TDK50760.1 RHS repeat-associated core domain-containing protein [Pseudomonas moraviensis]